MSFKDKRSSSCSLTYCCLTFSISRPLQKHMLAVKWIDTGRNDSSPANTQEKTLNKMKQLFRFRKVCSQLQGTDASREDDQSHITAQRHNDLCQKHYNTKIVRQNVPGQCKNTRWDWPAKIKDERNFHNLSPATKIASHFREEDGRSFLFALLHGDGRRRGNLKVSKFATNECWARNHHQRHNESTWPQTWSGVIEFPMTELCREQGGVYVQTSRPQHKRAIKALINSWHQIRARGTLGNYHQSR